MIHTIFDIETTGYNPLENDVLEFGYIRINDNMEILSYGTYYFYKSHFDVEATAEITGLTRGFLEEHANEFDENVCAMVSMLCRANVIGKNSVGFDIPFLRKWVSKATSSRLQLGDVGLHEDLQIMFASRYRDLLRAKGIEVAHTKKGSLGEYVEALELQGEVDALYASLDKQRETKYHGALYDCVCTFLVYKKCKELSFI